MLHAPPRTTLPLMDGESLPLRPNSIRRDWLHRVANDVQALVDRYLGEPDTSGIENAFSTLPPPANELETILLDGLKAQAISAWRRTPPQRVCGLKAVRARDILESRYQEPWTLARLATEVACNRTTLEEAFKALTHVSIHEFLVRRRVEAGRELLVRTTDGIKEIAERVGFCEASLIRQFGRIVGMTPAEYRRQNQSR